MKEGADDVMVIEKRINVFKIAVNAKKQNKERIDSNLLPFVYLQSTRKKFTNFAHMFVLAKKRERDGEDK